MKRKARKVNLCHSVKVFISISSFSFFFYIFNHHLLHANIENFIFSFRFSFFLFFVAPFHFIVRHSQRKRVKAEWVEEKLYQISINKSDNIILIRFFLLLSMSLFFCLSFTYPLLHNKFLLASELAFFYEIRMLILMLTYNFFFFLTISALFFACEWPQKKNPLLSF